jgi:ABC-type Mn2+/Zn2+ transport system permease subunit
LSGLLDILDADFLLRDSLRASMLVGLLCPLIGVHFVLRRMIFLGVALPQLSAAGIAFAFLAYRAAVGSHEHAAPGERLLAMMGSFGFTFAGLLVLAALERRGRETVEARIGATYALAAAATILFLALDPYAEAQMVNLLRGDILTTADLPLLAAVLGAVAFALFAFRREVLLVSFDRDMAIVLGKRAGLWEAVLYLLIGVTISFGVMTAGPLVTFGFLVLPPLTARLLARRMASFALLASSVGALTAFVGFWAAYRLDLPLGPAEVAVAGLALAAVGAGRGLVRAAGTRREAGG